MDFVLESNFNEEKKHWDVEIAGEVDLFNSTDLKSKLLQLVEKNQSSLFINCKDLEYIDSTALGALVGVLKSVKGFGGEVHLLNIKPNLGKLFKITNLDKVFMIEGEKDV